MDSSAYLEVLSTHSQQIKEIIESQNNNQVVDERIETVFQHCGKITILIADERRIAQRTCDDAAGSDQIYGPLLTAFLAEDMLERLRVWCESLVSAVNDGAFTNRVRTEFLHIFETLLGESCTSTMRAYLICDLRLLIPVSCCLRDCESSRHDALMEKQLVATCCQMSIAFRDNLSFLSSVVDIMLNKAVLNHESDDPDNLDRASKLAGSRALISLIRNLVAFMNHDSIEVCESSRSAIIGLLALSRQSAETKTTESVPLIANVFCEQTHFCALLAASLSGFFSALPRDLLSHHMEEASNDDPVGRCWTRIDDSDVISCAPLRAFMSAYAFCDAVCAASNGAVRQLLAKLVQASFFEPVLAPALFDGAHDEVVSSTCLLELCARRTQSRALSHALISFVLNAKSDGYAVAHALSNRLLGASAALTVATIQLFNTLFQLRYNEAFVHALVIEPLMRVTHMDAAKLKAADGHQSAACEDSPEDDPFAYVQMASKLYRSGVPECLRFVNVDESTREHMNRTCETEFSEYLRDARAAIGASRDRLFRWRVKPAADETHEMDSDCDCDDNEDDEPVVVSNAENHDENDAGSNEPTTTIAASDSTDLQVTMDEKSPDAEEDSSNRFRVTNRNLQAARTNTPSNVSRSSSYYTLNFVELELDDEPGDSASGSPNSKPDLIRGKPDLITESNATSTRPDLVGLAGGAMVDDSGFDELHGATELSMVDINIDGPQTSGSNSASINELITELRGVLGEVVPTFGVPTERELQEEAMARRGPDLPNYADEQARFDETFLRKIEAEFTKRRAIRGAKERQLASRLRKNASLLADHSDSNASANPNVMTELGSFLSALFWRLESFSENHVAVNLSLTGLLFQITSIPHFLIRTFMLGSTSRRTKNLFELLIGAKNKADRIAVSHETNDLLRSVADAYQTLLGRMQGRCTRPEDVNSSFDAGVHALAQQNDRKVRKMSAGGTIFDLFRGRQHGPTHRKLSLASAVRTEPHGVSVAGNQRFRNYVFAIIILKEFLKELAALCIEHAAAQVSDAHADAESVQRTASTLETRN